MNTLTVTSVVSCQTSQGWSKILSLPYGLDEYKAAVTSENSVHISFHQHRKNTHTYTHTQTPWAATFNPFIKGKAE